MMTRGTMLLAATAGLLSAPAAAHDGPRRAIGLIEGLVHPLSGADHILTFAAVGVLAAIRPPAERVALPLALFGAAAAGLVAGQAGFAFAAAETAILLLMAALALAVARAHSAGSGPLVLLMAATGFAHGFVHGAVVRSSADWAGFAIGAALGSLLLFAIGLAAGLFCRRYPKRIGGTA